MCEFLDEDDGARIEEQVVPCIPASFMVGSVPIIPYAVRCDARQGRADDGRDDEQNAQAYSRAYPGDWAVSGS